ncbi:MAG: T9SS type A sorting domain-containing protein, partial [Saprospiraceae bacterium]
VFLVIAALPVELVGFQARAEGHTARLDWQTATETNNRGFEVQHSKDATDWQACGFVPGKGNSTQAAAYEFQVNDLLAGTHFFRLRQIDLDGTDRLSEVRSLTVRHAALQAELLPNIVRENCTLHLQTGQPGVAEIEIFRMDGRAVGLHWTLPMEGETDWPLPTAALPAGVYLVAVRTEAAQLVLRLVKQ